MDFVNSEVILGIDRKAAIDKNKGLNDNFIAYRDEKKLHEGDDYQAHMFDRSYFGGNEESQRLIDYYKTKIDMTDDDIKGIKDNMHAAPAFDVITQEQYNSKNRLSKYKYRRKVKKYFKKRRDNRKEVYDKDKDFKDLKVGAQKASRLDRKLFVLDEKVRIQEKINGYYNDGVYQDVQEDADAMEAAYQREKSNDFRKAELDVAAHEAAVQQINKGTGMQALDDYTSDTAKCYQMNNYLRFGVMSGYGKNAEKGLDLLKSNKIGRDLVVRRGVKGVKTLGYMLNLPNVDKMSYEDIKNALEQKIHSKEEIIMSDKGFISTSLPFVYPSYAAEGENNINNPSNNSPVGIEFIILAKKGTHALNLTTRSNFAKECELLLKPGTKFKMVKAITDGSANLENGSAGSWKIYLTTIPSSEDGELKEAS
ncbi:ADP-ribosyltransferase exoenzyme [Pseudobutyrivibrio ruminis]|uniref:ADP-ribosyltransferase exoenzyme n=1 Tax=Pseudobutyrivibrio ruminis TaxID=46206 RepID=A0A1H7EWK5_9FIRM|nr:ADP-ribosyltransferase [Pseudobutyrivibrio ruminis]SEK17497.1 ADP-ribosyltransferase exoenzyme [Pseudobutyrivibrio ruminis]